MPARLLLLASVALVAGACAEQGTDAPTSTATFPRVGSSYHHRVTVTDSVSRNQSVRVDTTRVTETGLMRGGEVDVVHLDLGHLFGYYRFLANGDVAKLVYLYDPITFRAIDSGWQMMPFGTHTTTQLSLAQSSSGKLFGHAVECSYIGTGSQTVGARTFSTLNVRIVRTASIATIGGTLDFAVTSVDTVSYAPQIFGFTRWAVAEQAIGSSDTTGTFDVSELEAYQVR